MGLRFTDPPEPNVRIGNWSYDWLSVAGELKANPGQWAMLDPDGPVKVTIVAAIRNRKIRYLLPEHGFQVVQRNTRNSANPPVCDAYVRYVPERDQRLADD